MRAHDWPSLADTVVWECCKDDHQSQRKRAKFGPQPTLNPLADRHQIWITWLRRRHLPTKMGSIRACFYSPHIGEVYILNLRMFSFFGSSDRLPERPLDGFWRSVRHSTSSDAVTMSVKFYTVDLVATATKYEHRTGYSSKSLRLT